MIRRYFRPVRKRAFALPLILFILSPASVMAHDDEDRLESLLQHAEKMELRIEALELKVSRYEKLFDLFDGQRGLFENLRKQQDWDYNALNARLEKIERIPSDSREKHFRRRF